MEKRTAAVLAVAAFLLGCTGEGGGGGSPAAFYGNSPGVMMPESPVAYTAHYKVSENGELTDKVVYREGRNMRMDYVLGASNVSVFFIGDNVYSCANSFGGGYSCFDVTEQAARQGLVYLVVKPDFRDAELDEVVPVGGNGELSAQCYVFSDFRARRRKTCITDWEIIAYDEYEIPKGIHVEYMTYLKLGVGLRDFALPQVPVAAPQNLTYYGERS